MKRLLLLGVLVLGSIPFTQAQTCNCGSWNTLISRQTFQNSGNNFNCYQYARAYFSQPRSNAWVPSSSQWSWISSLDQTTIANDPSFSEVSDPQQADVVLYGCDHVAVVIANNCLISKMTYDELGTHGLNLAGCGADDVRFFKYNGYSYITPHGVDLSCQTQSGGCQNTPSNASVSGTYYSAGAGSRTLYTFNNVNAGSINATLSNISNVSYQWTRTGGSASFFVSNNGRNMSVTLNSGSISFQVQALNGCGNPIGASRTFVFQVNSSGGGFWRGSQPESDLTLAPTLSAYPNPAKNSLQVDVQGTPDAHHVSLMDISGKEILSSPLENSTQLDVSATENGLYWLQVWTEDNRPILREKVVISH